VEYHAGELFPRVRIVTNLETPSRAVVQFYNKRGTAEQWIKEGKQAAKMDCTPKVRHEIKGQFTLNGGEQWRCPDSNIPAN